MGALRPPITPHDHVRGAADAPVTLVEYGDYQCPHCGAAHSQVKLVERHFGNLLRFGFRHFPLSQAHPSAEPAADCAETAGTCSRFWSMHDAIYENPDDLGLPAFLALARMLSIPEIEVRDAIMTHRFASKI